MMVMMAIVVLYLAGLWSRKPLALRLHALYVPFGFVSLLTLIPVEDGPDPFGYGFLSTVILTAKITGGLAVLGFFECVALRDLRQTRHLA